MASITQLASGPLSSDEQAVLQVLQTGPPTLSRLTHATGFERQRLEQALAQLTRRGVLRPSHVSTPPPQPIGTDRHGLNDGRDRKRDDMSIIETGWLRAAWQADRQAASAARALRDQDGGLVILPGGRRRCRDSALAIASLLARTGRTPAVVIGSDALVGWRRTALAERLPQATATAVDWCHPAPAEPRDLTMLSVKSLGRACATLAGYQPETIAVLSGIRPWPSRDTAALEYLIGNVPAPLIVLEEWADPQVIAIAVAHTAGVSIEHARRTVDRWLGQRDPWRRPARRLLAQMPGRRDPSLGVLTLCDRHPAGA